MDAPKYRLKNAISSLADNMKYRPNALDDIEADLEYALAAVKEMIAREAKERIEAWDAMHGRKYK
jgi:hypothetical protein